MNYYILVHKKPLRVYNNKELRHWLQSANREVERTELPNGIIVVTEFLGQAECIDENKSPLLFETMIRGGINDGMIQQYATWEDAKEGHKKTAELVSTE